MRSDTIKTEIVDRIKDFLLRNGKQVFEFGKRIYYVDYNGCPHKLVRS